MCPSAAHAHLCARITEARAGRCATRLAGCAQVFLSPSSGALLVEYVRKCEIENEPHTVAGKKSILRRAFGEKSVEEKLTAP